MLGPVCSWRASPRERPRTRGFDPGMDPQPPWELLFQEFLWPGGLGRAACGSALSAVTAGLSESCLPPLKAPRHGEFTLSLFPQHLNSKLNPHTSLPSGNLAAASPGCLWERSRVQHLLGKGHHLSPEHCPRSAAAPALSQPSQHLPAPWQGWKLGFNP